MSGGRFVDGVWRCNCNPSLPAKYLQVQKNTANKGRWFYKCPKERDDLTRCSLFLWNEDAQRRETSALNNGGLEPNHNPGPSNAPITPSRQPPPPYTVAPPSAQPSRKRARCHNEDSDDDDLDGGRATHEFDNALHQVMNKIETPNRATRTMNFATPVMPRPNQADQSGLQTPQTERRPLDDPFVPRPRGSGSGGSLFMTSRLENQTQQTATPSSTPSSSLEATTPSRPKNSFGGDLEQDVFDLLEESNVRYDTNFKKELKRILALHSNKATGYRMSRDVNQATIKARDAKVTELSHQISTLDAEVVAEKAKVTNLNLRINTLEAELVAEKALVESLRWDMQSET